MANHGRDYVFLRFEKFFGAVASRLTAGNLRSRRAQSEKKIIYFRNVNSGRAECVIKKNGPSRAGTECVARIKMLDNCSVQRTWNSELNAADNGRDKFGAPAEYLRVHFDLLWGPTVHVKTIRAFQCDGGWPMAVER